MKRNIIFILFAFIITSCSKEEALTPFVDSSNPFWLSEDSNEPIDLLRKEFYDKTGIYLLANDTLKKVKIGVDKNGKDIYEYEKLNLGYGVTSASKTKYDYKYIKDIDSLKFCLDYMSKVILPSIPKDMHPYSILITKKIYENFYRVEEGETDGYYSRYKVDYVNAPRCTAFAFDKIFSKKLSEKEYKLSYLSSFIEKELKHKGKVLEDFFSYGKKYYGKTVVKKTAKIKDFKDVGILSGRNYYITIRFDSSDYDLREFIKQFLTNTKDEFYEKYSKYPIVISKYEIISKLITKLGFKI